ncbi:MAG: alpha-galactosidase [Vallitaleaceae bacterium]|jgi:alpha-galactosidase|nr:alpha-galactosidase [Vallitaleaceae bacterium]
MGIIINDKQNRIHLFTENTSYVLEVFEGELLHAYWGSRLELPEAFMVPIENMSSFYPNPNGDNKTYSLDILPREFPDFGRSDYRNPAIRLRLEDGSSITKFHVSSFELSKGKPVVPGLPATYAEDGDLVETLIVELIDDKSSIHAYLYYSIFETYDVITRHVQIVNKSQTNVLVDLAMSASVDFYGDHDFEMIHFNGSWARERELSRVSVSKSTHIIESRRGASSHMQNPLVLLARPSTTDLTGDVYGMNLVYSGNYKAVVEVNSYDSTRYQMGLNDFDFEWQIEPGKSFFTPEVVMTFSNEGFNGMSYNYHRLYQNRLCRGMYRDKERPILINNWEATYFDFDAQKIKDIVDVASDLEMEVFVLDDGWFGKRNSDTTSLGDWYVNKDKLPDGLTGISRYTESKELSFGLWFEPEMVSLESELYKKHPDWCLHTEGHSRSEGRNQLVLDLSREDVQNYIIESLDLILKSHPIKYVKWDMNRNMTEVGSKLLLASNQREVSHRYILGLYRILETITQKYSHILFESCSGGGGRFDPGMLYYMPQTWTSDNTDAHDRISIQYGTSYAYPQITMGAHVSMSPNHQVGREIDLERRTLTAMMANMGYELDLTVLTSHECEQLKNHIRYYKRIRRDIQFGRLYRIHHDEKRTAFMIESEDQKRYYVFYYRGLNRPNITKMTLPLYYLSEGGYQIRKIDIDTVIEDSIPHEDETVYPASYLNKKGYTFDYQKHDFDGQLLVFTKL